MSPKTSQFWLLGIGTCLVAIHLTLASRAAQASLLSSSLLFWIAIAYLIWNRRSNLTFDSGVVSHLSGAILIGLVLIRSIALTGYDPFLRITPLLSAIGLALLASGFKSLQQYWREFLILCFLIPSPGAMAFLVNISTQTAQFATFLLWRLGFNVSRQGVYVMLPEGSIEVYPGCSGIESMLHLAGLATLFLVMFPTTRLQKFLVPIVALICGFTVNGVRVALMAYLAAYSTPASLDYWHIGEGSSIFSAIAALILGLFCFWLLQHNDSEASMES